MKRLRNLQMAMADVVCSWCSKPYGSKPMPGGKPTHGICQKCLKEMLAGRRPSGIPSGLVAA